MSYARTPGGGILYCEENDTSWSHLLSFCMNNSIPLKLDCQLQVSSLLAVSEIAPCTLPSSVFRIAFCLILFHLIEFHCFPKGQSMIFEFSVGQTSQVRVQKTKCTVKLETSPHVLVLPFSSVCIRMNGSTLV